MELFNAMFFAVRIFFLIGSIGLVAVLYLVFLNQYGAIGFIFSSALVGLLIFVFNYFIRKKYIQTLDEQRYIKYWSK